MNTNELLKWKLDDINCHDAADIYCNDVEVSGDEVDGFSTVSITDLTGEALKRIEELETALSKLPKTADGVTIIPGDDVWFALECDDSAIPIDITREKVESIACELNFTEYVGGHTILTSNWEGGNLECYSTEEKAKEANPEFFF